MTPVPPHGTPAGDATLAIQKLARATGQNVQDLMTIYVLEGLLTRLGKSSYRDDFVLKGGALLAAFAARRPTKDIDLQATSLDNEPDTVATRITEIAAVEVADGVDFDLTSIKTSIIRDDDQYSGIRVSLTARLGTAQLRIGVDVNFGDPIWPDPGPVEVPRIVDVKLEPITVLGYPLTMVLGEKIVTAIDRGVANTRWRDFADVSTLIGTRTIPANDLLTSIHAIAEYRHTVLTTLLPVLGDMSERAQTKWSIWRTRTGRTDLPDQFADVLQIVSDFADPAITGEARGKTWNPTSRTWQ